MKMKKNKNIFLIISIIFISIIISGCSISSITNSNENSLTIGSGSSSISSSKASTAGVVLEFDEKSIPEKMYVNQPVTFILHFKNYLEIEIKDLELITKGFDRSLIHGLPESMNIRTIPKMTSISPGEYQQVISGIVGNNINEYYNFKPTFEYAYSAKTKFIEQICIPNTKNTCEIKVDKYQNQNGPVTIKINRISNYNNEIRIDFIATNSGNGVLVNSNDKFNRDSYAVDYSLDYVKLGSSNGNCKSLGVENFQFMNEVGNFYCIFPRSSEDSYASQISLEMSYSYNQEVSKNILVENLNANIN